MRSVASKFSAEANIALKAYLDIELSDAHDYSDDEMEDLYMRITDEFPYESAPELKSVFEAMIDVFIANNFPH